MVQLSIAFYKITLTLDKQVHTKDGSTTGREALAVLLYKLEE